MSVADSTADRQLLDVHLPRWSFRELHRRQVDPAPAQAMAAAWAGGSSAASYG